ncbi:MAG TPA: hypothetical protein VFZ24_10120 [Longimicrobiales bacterium]
MKSIVLLPFTCVMAACGPSRPPDDSPQATIAVMTELRPGTPLEEMLEMLDQHLVNAMAGEMEGDALDEFSRAEAITDRLLEARMPFEWIPSERYSLESRLRQIQSSADRVMAQVRVRTPRMQMLQDLRLLRTDVARLRQTVAAGGTQAPAPIDRLLAGDTAVIRSPAPAAGTPDNQSRGARPLGTPISRDTT